MTVVCNQCQDKGFVIKVDGPYEIVVPCDCRREDEFHVALQDAGIPRKYQCYTLSDGQQGRRRPFKPAGGFYARGLGEDDAHGLRVCKMTQGKALTMCRGLRDAYLAAFLHGQDAETPGLLLSGSCGVGKTHLAATLLVDLIYEGCRDVRFIEYTHLMRQLRFSYRGGEIGEREILEPLVRAKVLVLDDLGAQATDNVTWTQDILGYLLNERYGSLLPTIVTTNYPDEDFEPLNPNNRLQGPPYLVDRIGTRLRSRLREMCPQLTLEGLDLRNLLESQKPKTASRSRS